MATVTKNLITRADLNLFDGVNTTTSRVDSTGGTVSSVPIGDEIDILSVYGGGTAFTDATINAAISKIGSLKRTIVLSVGTWIISNNVTTPNNIVLVIPLGATISIDSGKTVAFGGEIIAGPYQIFSGAGTVSSVKNLEIYPEWYGAIGGDNDADTTAVQAAMTLASASGGGDVILSKGIYKVSELTFNNLADVRLVGRANGYAYEGSDTKNNSVLRCTSGVFAVRLPDTSDYCGMVDVTVLSDGAINDSGSVPVISTAGVEYGILVETGNTHLLRVGVNGFQYGCVLANAGNSNVFEMCSFSYNTKIGFAVTNATAGAYALYHPNLSVPAALVGTTIYSLKNCNIRRNGWGIVLRSGSGGSFLYCTVESNYYGGLIAWRSDATIYGAEIASNGQFDRCYFENNWYNFNPANAWYASAVEVNKLLQITAGVYIPLAENANNALSELGYQITAGDPVISTADGPPFFKFDFFQMSMVGSQKAIFLQSSFEWEFNNCSATGGDTANAVKLSNSASGYSSGTIFKSFNGTIPATLGNRGASIVIDRSDYGGYRADIGGWAGQFFKWSATPFTATNKNTMNHYESDSFTGSSESFTVTQIGTINYVRIGDLVTLQIPQFVGTSDTTTLTITGLPAALHPSAEAIVQCFTQDNTGAFAISIMSVKTNGDLQPYNGFGAAFTAAGTKSVYSCVISYVL